jgi:myosin heavy subunit
MDTLGFDQATRQSMWRILAGILTLGNVEFKDDSLNAQTGQTLVKVSNTNGTPKLSPKLTPSRRCGS